MSKPKISIIIPCYNMGGFIDEAIQSVQQYPDNKIYEIIVVNDGSDDTYTIGKLKHWEDKGIKIIHQENKGLGNARNTGIQAAQGDYILLLDADNKILPEYVSLSIEEFDQHPETAIIYGDALFFGEENKIKKVPDFSIEALLKENYIDACTVFRKEVWNAVGGFDENMPVMGWEDWDFWLRAFFKGYKFKHINKVLFEYRVRGDSMIQTTKQHQEILRNYIFSKPELADAGELRNSFQRLYKLNRLKEDFHKSFIYKISRKFYETFNKTGKNPN